MSNRRKQAQAEEKIPSRMGIHMRSVYIGLAALAAYLDYSTKQEVKQWLLRQGGDVEINPILNIVSITNSGAAFGMLSQFSINGFNLLALVSGAVIVGLYAFIYLYRKLTHAIAFAAALMLGGGIGNGIERMLQGSVYDFIDVHIGSLHWPAFNVADICISAGALLAVLLIWRAPQGKA